MFDITAFKKALDAKQHSLYIEQLAFLILNHFFPEFSSKFILGDKPDIQAKDHSIGIEVTEAVLPEIAKINGEYAKLRYGKQKKQEIERCKKLIEQNGGIVTEIGLTYPVTDSESELCLFTYALQKKLEKLPAYRNNGFEIMGLFIFFDEPPIPFDPKAVMERFCEIQKGCKEQYDFLFLAYRNGVIYFDFPNMSYKVYPIKQNAFDNLSICARKLVEKSKNG